VIKKQKASLHPDLVIDQETALDRMGNMASRAADQQKSNFHKQIQLVRRYAKSLCERYINCRQEDWCWHCSSGQNNRPLFRGSSCLECKLFTSDARFKHKQPILVQISNQDLPEQSR